MEKSWQIFVCYRQVDGENMARWLFKSLNERSLPGAISTQQEPPRLALYFDQAAPAVANWHQVHRPALESSRALLLVCTPGLYARLDGEDWVHMELDWWLQHRQAAPILVDATGEGSRWIPDAVRNRWPHVQRVHIDLESWNKLPQAEKAAREELIVQRILGGITASEAKTRLEDAQKQRALNLKLKRTLILGIIALIFAAVGVFASLWFAYKSAEQQREASRQLALSLMAQAEQAWVGKDVVSARTLAARALAHENSEELRDRYFTLENWMDGRFNQALQYLEHTLERDLQHALDIASLPDPTERLARAQSARRSFESLLAISSEIQQTEYDAVLHFKNLTHRVGVVGRGRFLRSPGYKHVLDNLRFTEAELARLSYHPPQSDDDHSQWSGDYAAVSKRLAALYRATRFRINLLDLSIHWKQLQTRLSEDEAIVDYLRYRDRYAVWILKSQGEPVRREVGGAFEVEKEAHHFRDAVLGFPFSEIWDCGGQVDSEASERTSSSPSRGIRLPSQSDPVRPVVPPVPGPHRKDVPKTQGCRISPEAMAFRRRVWEPVDRELGKAIKTVYIVPDAMLATVPFSALPGSEPRNFLLDERLIVYLSGAQDLLAEQEAVEAGRGMLLMGGVDYGEHAREVRATSFAAKFQQIRGTLIEVEAIEKHLRKMPGVRPLLLHTGSAATEASFRNDAPGRWLLHLATHGWVHYAVESLPMDKHGTPSAETIDAYLTTLNPSLHSGLALSPPTQGSLDGRNDGVLTALEVSSLDLRGVNLVVLSGCDTVGAPAAGDAAIGLFRAFREAGAAAVVASLSPVADEPTADLMVRFYQKLATSNHPAVALRAAALEIKRDGLHPFFWASFVAYSSGRAENRASDDK